MYKQGLTFLCLWIFQGLMVNAFPQDLMVGDTILNNRVYINVYEDDNLTSIELPPFEELAKAALANSPNLSSLLLNIEIRTREAKSTNREWLRFIGASASYGTGNTAMLSSNSTDSYVPPGWLYSSSQRDYYNAGVAISIPFQTLIDWRNRSKIRQATIKQAEYSAKQYEQDLKREILALYNEAILTLNQLKARTQAVRIASAGLEIMEADFAMGKVNFQSLSVATQDRMRTLDDLDNTKARLRASLTTLEFLCNIKMFNTDLP